MCSFKQKREEWERKMEAERQHDRAFAMQAAHAAGMPTAVLFLGCFPCYCGAATGVL